MRFRSENPMRRVLIGCTAVSVLGVMSALLDYGLSHGLLWSPGNSGLRPELTRLASELLNKRENANYALAFRPEGVPVSSTAALQAESEESAKADPPGPEREPDISTAATRSSAASLFEGDQDAAHDVNRFGKADRLTLAEMSVPKLILPQAEPITEGASAALFLLAPPVPVSPVASAPLATGPVAPSPVSANLRAKTAFVTSATAAATAPPPAKYTWNDLVRMASMKGGNGEEPAQIFGALTEKEFRARELRCMATAIYFEARGESVRGQIAVGQVVMTRVRSDFYPKTICGVVFQGQWNKNACQFSFACDGATDVPKEKEQWAAALDVAKQVISGKAHLSDIAEATHYHAVYVRPHWAKMVKRIKQIGIHIFYKSPLIEPLVADAAYQTL